LKFNYIYTSLFSVLLTACTSSSGITPDGSNSYRIVHTGDTGFTNSNTLQKNAYQEASDFCAKKGKVVETVNMESKQSRPFGGWPEASLLFKCVVRETDT
jgi:hypothetical protein